jgi:hypothetical protein
MHPQMLVKQGASPAMRPRSAGCPDREDSGGPAGKG